MEGVNHLLQDRAETGDFGITSYEGIRCGLLTLKAGLLLRKTMGIDWHRR